MSTSLQQSHHRKRWVLILILPIMTQLRVWVMMFVRSRTHEHRSTSFPLHEVLHPAFSWLHEPPFLIRSCMKASTPATVFIILHVASCPRDYFHFSACGPMPLQTPLSLCVRLHALATIFISLHEAPCPCNHFHFSTCSLVPSPSTTGKQRPLSK